MANKLFQSLQKIPNKDAKNSYNTVKEIDLSKNDNYFYRNVDSNMTVLEGMCAVKGVI